MPQPVDMLAPSAPSPLKQSALRVGMILAELCARGDDGSLVYYSANGRLFQALRERLPNSRMLVNVLPELQPGMNHPVYWPERDVVQMPMMRTTPQAQLKYFAVCRAFREFAKTVDALLVRLPTLIPNSVVGLGKPKVLQVVNDPVEFIGASNDYPGPLRWLANWYARHSERTIRRMAAEPDSRTITHGRAYWEKLGRPVGRVIVSSGLYERELSPKSDLTLHDPPRLLFAGFLRPEKGVPVLMEAFEKLRSRRPLKLTVAGGTDRNSLIEGIVHDQISRSKYSADIKRVGKVEFGEPLFNLYREHDIYVLPSLAEGTPRTLVEARAFGCAVVATNVGGVPTSIEDGRDGLLVPPGDADALAAAMDRLLSDEPLRRRLIEEGIRKSKQLTVERFADQIVEELTLLPQPSNSAHS